MAKTSSLLGLFALLLTTTAHAAPATPDFKMTSPDISTGATLAKAQVNAKASCGGGGDRSPALSWTAPPAGTKSLAITMFDPDARGGRGWWHWALLDLPADTRSLPADAGKPGAKVPQGALETKNSFGEMGYGGACPPPGDKPHHYAFVLWAVGAGKPPFEAGASTQAADTWLRENAIGHADIIARYGR